MNNPPPDSSVESSILILRDKKQFLHKISFALSCITQSLRSTNPRYQDNIRHLFTESIWVDFALILNSYEDPDMTQNILYILTLLLVSHNEVGLAISQTDILKGLQKNVEGVGKNIELFMNLMKRVGMCEVSLNWEAQKAILLSKLLVIKLSETNILSLLAHLQDYDSYKIEKTDLFSCLANYDNTKISRLILYQIYRRIDLKKDRLSNSEMNQLLRLIEDNIGDCELSYIIYFVVSRFYSYKQALVANPDHKLITAYVFALGEANMGFYPSFTDEKSFIYTFAILSEGDRFSECYTKVLMPKFSMIQSEAAELKFLSELKKISLKQDVKLMYNPLKQTLAQSKHPQLTGQYQYLLKHLDGTHQIPKATSPIIIDNVNFKTDKEFLDYFTSILLLCVLFDADLPTEETGKFLQQALRFCKLNRELASKYLSFLSQLVIKLQSAFSKNQNYQNLLVQVYIQSLQSSVSLNKTSKLEEAIVRTFAYKVQTLAKERDSVRLGVIMANLVTHSTFCQTALSKLGSLSPVLRSSDFKINTKLHLILRLLKSCEHSNKINQAVFNFLQPVIDQLQKGQDNSKVAILSALAMQLPKLEKNFIYIQVVSDKSIMFLLERMFYVLISLVKNLQCNQLFELIFELEQWMPLQEMLRRNQAEKILAAALENYSPFTPDIIQLCEIVFGEPDSDYFQKTASIRAQIHKGILKNLDKYNLQALDAYTNALAVFGETTIKQPTLEHIKTKSMQLRCPELKKFVLFHEAPSEDPTIVNVISDSLRELAQRSNPQSKGDNSLDTCASSLLVSVMWIFQDSEKDIPITIIQSLNTLLSCPSVSTHFIRKALQAISALPHTFNLAKIQYTQLYEKFASNVEVLSGLNQLVKIIAQSSPKALNNFKFQTLVEEYLYFLVFQKDSELTQSKTVFVENVCLVESNYNQFLQSKSFVLEKILKADLSNATFYRPKIIQSILNIMDQLSLLKNMGFQLCKLLEKYIDQPDIVYMILLNLKGLPQQVVTGNLDQRTLANIIMNSQDKQLLEMSNGLMSHYHGVVTNKQQKFVEAFASKNYGECEELIANIQKPHEVEFVKKEVNAFLGANDIDQFPKVREFIMTNKKVEPVLYQCQTFYKDTTLLNDLVKKFEEIDTQYPVFSVQNSKVLTAKPSLDMNIDSIKSMIQKQNFIQNYAQSILKGDQLDQLPKVKLIILLSKVPELTALCDTVSVRKLLEKQAYQGLFYNSGIAFQLFNDQQVNILSMINHLQAHLRQRDISKAQENDYVCRIVKFILNHKQKNAQYFIKLLQVILACRSVQFPSNIDMLANLSHQLMNIIHQQRRGLKFSSAKEEVYFNNLELVLVEFYQSSVILSDVNNLSMKTMDRMYSICNNTFQYDILTVILLKYLQGEQKDRKKQEEILSRFSLEDKADQLSDAGKDVYAQIMGRSWSIVKEESVKKMLESTIKNASVSGKHSSMETLREYSLYMDQLIVLKSVPENNRLTDVVKHMMEVCENQYYYNRILKQKMVEKLITLFYIQSNEVLNILLRVSHNKNNEILKSDLVLKFLKDRLKKILESKPVQSAELVKLVTLLGNSEYNLFELYFNGGLYSTLMEILKAKVMQKQILRFFVNSKMNEKLVNELYQRGLIQYSIERVSNKHQQSTQWIALLARICINPAIQSKLIGVNIHQQVLSKFVQIKDESLLKACAAFFASLSFNNEVAVKWIIDKMVVERYIQLQNSSSMIVEIAKSMYSVAYNNNAGKKHIKDVNGIQYLLKEYKKWAQGINQSDYQPPWSIMKTLSTLALDQQSAAVMIKEKILKTILSGKVLISGQENCFNPIQLVHNIIINVQNPKQYQELKADKLNEILREIKLFDINSSIKQQECLIATLLMMAKWELAGDKHLNTEFFEYTLQVVLKNNLSDQIAKSVLTRFIQCVGTCKDVGVSQGIITKVQKIALKSKSNILDLQLLGVIQSIRDTDLVRSILSKGELGGIVCDMYDELKSGEARIWNSYLNCLSILAQSHVISNVIVSNIGSRLLESPIELQRLNVICCIAQYEDVAQYLIELNAVTILARELTLIESKSQLQQLFSAANKILRAKLLTASEKQLWINALTKHKLPVQLKEAVENLKNLILGNSKAQMSTSVKDYITKGVSCYLYKSDGSVSKLQVIITKSLNEINCIKEGDNVVKPKWRVPINEIRQLVSYTEQDKYEKTNFYKSGFLSKKPQMDKCLSVVSKNNNLHISFPTKQAKQKWLSCLIVVQEHILQMLLMIK